MRKLSRVALPADLPCSIRREKVATTSPRYTSPRTVARRSLAELVPRGSLSAPSQPHDLAPTRSTRRYASGPLPRELRSRHAERIDPGSASASGGTSPSARRHAARVLGASGSGAGSAGAACVASGVARIGVMSSVVSIYAPRVRMTVAGSVGQYSRTTSRPMR